MNTTNNTNLIKAVNTLPPHLKSLILYKYKAVSTPTSNLIKQSINSYLWVNGEFEEDVDKKQTKIGDSYYSNGFYINGF